MMRLRLGELLSAGGRAVSRYTGTVFAVFLVQTLVALTCVLAIAVVLAQTFSHLPLFDEAVDGDLVAIVYCLRYGKPSFLAVGGIVFGALLLWQVMTWFLVGGLCGVLEQRPEGRREVARTFGASGATTFLTYARLAICGLPAWLVVLFLLGLGTSMAAPQIDTALTVPQLIGPFLLGWLPAALLGHLLFTVADYARIELAIRNDSHAPGVVATYLRTFAWVIKRPLTLLHAGFGWFAIALVTAAYAYLSQGHPMYGAGGALTLFLVRQGVSLLRTAIRIGVIAGQVELGRTRPLPPRRVETKPPAQA